MVIYISLTVGLIIYMFIFERYENNFVNYYIKTTEFCLKALCGSY